MFSGVKWKLPLYNLCIRNKTKEEGRGRSGVGVGEMNYHGIARHETASVSPQAAVTAHSDN